MELFTLGADRGYAQRDVHQQARALTGFTNDWSDARGPHNFRFDPKLHDDGVKTIFKQRSGSAAWTPAACACPRHPPVVHGLQAVGLLRRRADPGRRPRALERPYVRSGFEIRALVEAILRHPLFYEGERMVIAAGVLTARACTRRQTVQTDAWAWIGDQSGQRLFEPPNVAGWDYAHWLDTSRWTARFQAMTTRWRADHRPRTKSYPAREERVGGARHGASLLGRPGSRRHPQGPAAVQPRRPEAQSGPTGKTIPYRAMRQNALRR